MYRTYLNELGEGPKKHQAKLHITSGKRFLNIKEFKICTVIYPFKLFYKQIMKDC